MDASIETFYSLKNGINILPKSDLIINTYNCIVDIIKNNNEHIEVKRHLITELITSIKKFQHSNFLTTILFPDNTNYLIISGIFGPFDIDSYKGINITYIDGILDDKLYEFSPSYNMPKPEEINMIDINNIQYDENNIPIPPPLPSFKRDK